MPRGAASPSPTSVEWLFDTHIFKATMTAEMEREANLFRNEFRNESKEDTTMTKTTKTAKTTAKTTKKETTMPKTNEPKNPQDKILALKASYENAIKQAKTLRKRAKKGDVTNFVTGRPVNRDDRPCAQGSEASRFYPLNDITNAMPRTSSVRGIMLPDTPHHLPHVRLRKTSPLNARPNHATSRCLPTSCQHTATYRRP